MLALGPVTIRLLIHLGIFIMIDIRLGYCTYSDLTSHHYPLVINIIHLPKPDGWFLTSEMILGIVFVPCVVVDDNHVPGTHPAVYHVILYYGWG